MQLISYKTNFIFDGFICKSSSSGVFFFLASKFYNPLTCKSLKPSLYFIACNLFVMFYHDPDKEKIFYNMLKFVAVFFLHRFQIIFFTCF